MLAPTLVIDGVSRVQPLRGRCLVRLILRGHEEAGTLVTPSSEFVTLSKPRGAFRGSRDADRERMVRQGPRGSRD